MKSSIFQWLNPLFQSIMDDDLGVPLFLGNLHIPTNILGKL